MVPYSQQRVYSAYRVILMKGNSDMEDLGPILAIAAMGVIVAVAVAGVLIIGFPNREAHHDQHD